MRKWSQIGNVDSFARLFAEYEAELYRIAFVYVRHEQDALDVVQETAYRAFKGAHQLKETRYFKTWLIRIAISCAMDLLRKRKRLALLSAPSHMDNLPEPMFESSNEKSVDLSLSLQSILHELDDKEKGLILLRYYQDYTIRETAELLDMPLGTAKTILYRALGKLRLAMREEDYDE
ncbi:sigma-70 family RNA polymerase sigma factor [Paenibacillus sp. PL2-23]|uniref:sigma-70 family RNA polymerase sigma factor n=1 Tax=Paenibacillus sp. PL2-23 TaxID=2100729 RepID=UPI0030F8AB6D